MTQWLIDCSEQPLAQSFHASSELIAAALVDGTVEIHTYPTGLLQSVETAGDGDDTIVASIEIIDSPKISAGSSKSSCRAVQFSAHHTSRVFAARGHTLASCDLEKNTRGGNNLLDDRLVWAIHDATHNIQIITHSTSSSQLIFTGDDNGLVRVWDTRLCTSQTIIDEKNPYGCVMHCNCHSDYISGLQMIADGSLLFSSSADGTWAAMDLRKKDSKSKPMFQSDITDDDELLSLLFMEESNKVFCGTNRGVVKAWNGAETTKNTSMSTYQLDPSSCLFHHPPHHSIDTIISLDHDTVLTGCSDGFIRFFSISTNNFLGVLNPINEEIQNRPFISNDESTQDHKVHDLVTAGKGYPIERLDFTIQKKFVAGMSHDNFIRFYSLEDGESDEDDISVNKDDTSNGAIDEDECSTNTSSSSDETSESENYSTVKSKKQKRFKSYNHSYASCLSK